MNYEQRREREVKGGRMVELLIGDNMKNYLAIFRDKNWESFEYAIHAVDEAHLKQQIDYYLSVYKDRKFVSFYEVA